MSSPVVNVINLFPLSLSDVEAKEAKVWPWQVFSDWYKSKASSLSLQKTL
jgi:hypothetical protein